MYKTKTLKTKDFIFALVQKCQLLNQILNIAKP